MRRYIDKKSYYVPKRFGFICVALSKFCDQNSHNVEQEYKIYLEI